jgi:hypothetical protein
MKRAEAKALGLKFYRTGKPCKHEHLSERYTSTAICVDCVKISGIDKYKNNREAQLASWRKWYEANKDTHAVRVKRWQAANKDKTREDQKAWNKANPEKVKAKTLRHIKKYPEAYTARAVASVARRAKRVPQWLTSEDRWLMREAYNLAKLRTRMFGFTWEVDHIIPLRAKLASGLHVPTNLQVIPKTENRNKRNDYFLA